MKIKNKTELRKEMKESGNLFVIMNDGSWESANQFKEKEKYEELQNFNGNYFYKGYRVNKYDTCPGQLHQYRHYCFSENSLISEFFKDVEKGYFSREYKEKMKQLQNEKKAKKEAEEQAKKEEEEKREKALNCIPMILDELRKMKVRIGAAYGFESEEHKEAENTLDTTLKNYEAILGTTRFMNDVYGIKNYGKKENKTRKRCYRI